MKKMVGNVKLNIMSSHLAVIKYVFEKDFTSVSIAIFSVDFY